MSDNFALISDLHKDVHGFRPSTEWLMTFNSHSTQIKNDIWGELCSELSNNIKLEEQQHAAALDAFEARLQGMMDDYAISMADALRWDMDGAGLRFDELHDQDIEHYLWNQGLSFDDMPKFSEIIKKELVS